MPAAKHKRRLQAKEIMAWVEILNRHLSMSEIAGLFARSVQTARNWREGRTTLPYDYRRRFIQEGQNLLDRLLEEFEEDRDEWLMLRRRNLFDSFRKLAPKEFRLRSRGTTTYIKEFLNDRLADGPMTTRELRPAMEEYEISITRLNQVAKQMGIVKTVVGKGRAQVSTWELPRRRRP